MKTLRRFLRAASVAGLLGLGLVLLSACGSAPVRSASASKAHDLNRQGIDRFKAGELDRALALFQRALAVEQSIENEDGIAQARLNIAGVYQKMGRVPEAVKVLEPVVTDPALAFSVDRRAEAALKRATLFTQADDTAAAAAALDQASSVCAGSCGSAGRILNLRAHIALAAGQPADGLRWARRARNDNAGDELETANALRLEASAQLALKAPELAAPLLLQALALDKALGASEKIYQDLLLLGYAHMTAMPTARAYWRRAHEVASAAGEAASAEQVTKLLAAHPD